VKLRSIDHLTLQVRDLSMARRYYEELFGLECVELSHGETKSLQLEGPDVHFFMMESPDIDPAIIARQHVSFAVERLAVVRAKLEERGEPYEMGEYRGFRRRNYRWCEWRDPEGVRLECVEHT
jgi:catechol 2,3-dioxygenase-like lactoylglutathione lyase family enzyme